MRAPPGPRPSRPLRRDFERDTTKQNASPRKAAARSAEHCSARGKRDPICRNRPAHPRSAAVPAAET
jgi:hypothetical protein